jgi:hypothetical protein
MVVRGLFKTWWMDSSVWVMVHVKRASGLSTSCSDALLCQCIRGKRKRYATKVVLAHNGKYLDSYSSNICTDIFPLP